MRSLSKKVRLLLNLRSTSIINTTNEYRPLLFKIYQEYMNRSELIDFIGISPSVFYRWEKDKPIRLGDLILIRVKLELIKEIFNEI